MRNREKQRLFVWREMLKKEKGIHFMVTYLMPHSILPHHYTSPSSLCPQLAWTLDNDKLHIICLDSWSLSCMYCIETKWFLSQIDTIIRCLHQKSKVVIQQNRLALLSRFPLPFCRFVALTCLKLGQTGIQFWTQ